MKWQSKAGTKSPNNMDIPESLASASFICIIVILLHWVAFLCASVEKSQQFHFKYTLILCESLVPGHRSLLSNQKPKKVVTKILMLIHHTEELKHTLHLSMTVNIKSSDTFLIS